MKGIHNLDGNTLNIDKNGRTLSKTSANKPFSQKRIFTKVTYDCFIQVELLELLKLTCNFSYLKDLGIAVLFQNVVNQLKQIVS